MQSICNSLSTALCYIHGPLLPPSASKEVQVHSRCYAVGENSLDSFVEDMNQKILEGMKKIYTPQVIDRFYHPRNLGPMDECSGHSRVTGSCGETIEIWLKIDKNRIVRAAFLTDGCGPSIVCGSMATELATGRTLEEALDIQQGDILHALGGLPEESTHCAALAAHALHEAIDDFFQRNLR